MKNALIHIVDMLHHYAMRHEPPHLFNRWYLFCACDTLAESDWWTCERRDWYCRHLDAVEEGLPE